MNCSIKAVENMVDGAQKVKIIILKRCFSELSVRHQKPLKFKESPCLIQCILIILLNIPELPIYIPIYFLTWSKFSMSSSLHHV